MRERHTHPEEKEREREREEKRLKAYWLSLKERDAADTLTPPNPFLLQLTVSLSCRALMHCRDILHSISTLGVRQYM